MGVSPVGVSEWILEKFGVWADVPRRADGSPDLWQAFDEDTLLTNIMLYVAPQAFVTSTWMYRGWVLEKAGKFPPNTPVRVPPGIAAFPDPAFPPPPRSHAAKSSAAGRRHDMPAGRPSARRGGQEGCRTG